MSTYTPSVHELKTLPPYFEDVLSGRKTFELRQDDRLWCVGDTLRLREFDGKDYTGRECNRVITHGLMGPSFGLALGWIILSLGECSD